MIEHHLEFSSQIVGVVWFFGSQQHQIEHGIIDGILGPTKTMPDFLSKKLRAVISKRLDQLSASGLHREILSAMCHDTIRRAKCLLIDLKTLFGFQINSALIPGEHWRQMVGAAA